MMAGASIYFYYGVSVRLYEGGAAVLDLGRTTGDRGNHYVSYLGTYTLSGSKTEISYFAYTEGENFDAFNETADKITLNVDPKTNGAGGIKPQFYGTSNIGGFVGAGYSINEGQDGITLVRNR
jgi:hypothetical protein